MNMQIKNKKEMYGYGYRDTEDAGPVFLASKEDAAKFVLSDTSNKVVTDNLGIFLFDTVGTLINTYSKLCDIGSLALALIELNEESDLFHDTESMDYVLNEAVNAGIDIESHFENALRVLSPSITE